MTNVISLKVQKRKPMTVQQERFFHYMGRLLKKSGEEQETADIVNLGLFRAIRKSLNDREFWKNKGK